MEIEKEVEYKDEDEEQIKEKQTDFNKVVFEPVDDNQELSIQPTGRFFNKKDLLENSVVIMPKQLSIGKYGENLLFITDEGEEYLIDINKSNHNWLVENLGNKVSLWKTQKIVLCGESFESQNSRTKEVMAGIRIWFEKV